MPCCYVYITIHNYVSLIIVEVTIKCMNDERKMFSIVDKEKESILKIKDPSITEFHIA